MGMLKEDVSTRQKCRSGIWSKMLLAVVCEWSRFLGEVYLYKSIWFFREVYGSRSMNMLIAMAPKMWQHAGGGGGGGHPADWLLKWHTFGNPLDCHALSTSLYSAFFLNCWIVAITWKLTFCWLHILFPPSNELFLELKFLWCCILFESEFQSASSWIWWVVMNLAENILDEDDCDWYVKVRWQGVL